MQAELETLIQTTRLEVSLVHDLTALMQLRSHVLGPKGRLTAYLKQMKTLSTDQRQAVHHAKQVITELLESAFDRVQAQVLEQKLLADAIDVSLPGCGQSLGGLHPITIVLQRIERLLICEGFTPVTGPEIEDDYHNFTALNIPENHPARALHDTFYLNNGLLLRTHTSPVQIRAMREHDLPLNIIASGRVYRCDADVTHTPMFHQVEGLCIDTQANFAQLKGLLTHFLKQFFERSDLNIRFRPAYFPFTEPSAEVDASCVLCSGQGCRVCAHTGWLELLGCGMVHPNVLCEAGIDPERYRGYAFGMGVERLALIRYGIPDLRLMFEHDLRFLEQFKHEIQ